MSPPFVPASASTVSCALSEAGIVVASKHSFFVLVLLPCCGCSLVLVQIQALIQLPMTLAMTMLVVAMMRCRCAVMSACHSARALRRARRACSGKHQSQVASWLQQPRHGHVEGGTAQRDDVMRGAAHQYPILH